MRRGRAEGAYQSQIPQGQQSRRGRARTVQPRQSQPTAEESVATAAAEVSARFNAVLDTDGQLELPADWEQPQRVQLPGRQAEWAREVTAVLPTATVAKDFTGRYISTGQSLIAGAVVLAAESRPRRVVACYILMPGGFWYHTLRTQINWAPGWGRIIRRHVTEWVALTRLQRIMRACSEAILELRNDQSRVAAGTESEEQLLAAIAQFEQIAAVVNDEPRELSTDAIVRSFDAWIARVSNYTNSDRDQVIATLSNALEGDATAADAELLDTMLIRVPGVPALTDAVGQFQGLILAPGRDVTTHSELDTIHNTAALLQNQVQIIRDQLRYRSTDPGAIAADEVQAAELTRRMLNLGVLSILRRRQLGMHAGIDPEVLRDLSSVALTRLLADDQYWPHIATELDVAVGEMSQPQNQSNATTSQSPGQPPGLRRLARNIRIRRPRDVDA